MSRTFFRKFLPAVPRAAGRRRSQGLGPSRRRVRYYTLPRRGAVGKRSRTQDADNSSAVERRGTEGIPGGREPPSWRFAPIRSPGASPRSIHGTAPEARGLASPRPIDIIAPGAQRFGSVRMRSRPGGPALARLGPPGRSIQLCVSFYLYISRRIGLTFRPGALPPSICKRRFPYRWRFLIRLRQTSHEANTSRGCFRQPRARRKVPSCNRP